MKYTAILVDDEAHAIRTLSAQIGWTKLPIEITFTGNSVEETEDFLRLNKPDFLFLDIKMPGQGGFELFPNIDLSVTDVIFTTAHDEFALQAFQHQASGYLMKPVSTIELKNLLGKLINKRGVLAAESQDLLIQEKTGILKIPLSQILYISSEGSICLIHKTDGTRRSVNSLLKDLEVKLNNGNFYRIHHQYLVNLTKVKEIIKARNSEAILETDEKLPISRAKKATFYEVYESLNNI
ncbi:DNA-binding response regulator [Lacihabitans sp. LS3-19]|uniref:LytR/AlgR family response regulator transcription factor n=1 Tax=Lacihabitans sp. LS3-19 TaxID=2487335 RepID=UPI0020CCD3BC|nr:LytTR family DNA-binding domain-containing protein [Lacihabitans sp. LS3-19]MCP9768321.1 DNA-binding response regulator [Lacihabitans sp. LS3-19]